MYATRMVLTASVVEPKTSRKRRVHTTSNMRLAAPDKNRQPATAANPRGAKSTAGTACGDRLCCGRACCVRAMMLTVLGCYAVR
jgi:hypothetical protein